MTAALRLDPTGLWLGRASFAEVSREAPLRPPGAANAADTRPSIASPRTKAPPCGIRRHRLPLPGPAPHTP